MAFIQRYKSYRWHKKLFIINYFKIQVTFLCKSVTRIRAINWKKIRCAEGRSTKPPQVSGTLPRCPRLMPSPRSGYCFILYAVVFVPFTAYWAMYSAKAMYKPTSCSNTAIAGVMTISMKSDYVINQTATNLPSITDGMAFCDGMASWHVEPRLGTRLDHS